MSLRSAALALLALLSLPIPGAAQPAAAGGDAAAPADPAAAPPVPAALPPGPASGHARTATAPPPVDGLDSLDSGAWRLRFTPGEAALPPQAPAILAGLATRLAALPEGRVGLFAQVSGPDADVSAARRLSLARALAVKAALAAGGLAPTRIDIHPQGRIAEAADAVDIAPPETRARAG